MIQRKQVLVDRTFQSRLALELMVVVLVVPMVLWAVIYLAGIYVLTQNPGVSNLPREWGVMGVLFQQQWWLIVLFLGVTMGLVYGLILLYTHRMAGPVFRFIRALDDLASGKISATVQLRRNDYFENLGVSMTRATESLAQTMTELKAIANDLTVHAGTLRDATLVHQVDSLTRVLDRYQIESPPASSRTTG